MATIKSPNSVAWIKRLEQERDKLTDPPRVDLVNVLIRLSAAEAASDWDGALATLADDVVFQPTGFGYDSFVTLTKTEQRGFYEEQDRQIPGYHAGLEMDLERFVVSIDSLAFDGRLFRVMRGSQLSARGIPQPEDTSADDDLLVSWRGARFMSFSSDGLITRNHLYQGYPRVDSI